MGLGQPRADGDTDTAGTVDDARALPRCPYAARGIDDGAVGDCPGFTSVQLTFHGIGAGESIGQGESCAHLEAQPGGRGFVSACTHPGGLPEGAAELARRLPRRLRAHQVR